MSKLFRYCLSVAVAAWPLLSQPLLAEEGIRGNLVDVGWLEKNLKSPDLVLLDASPETYAEKHIPGAVYLSIDKDVLSTNVVRTNWDQGCFDLEHVRELIKALKGRLIGSDITGEVSVHHFHTSWKRWLSAMDRQPTIPVETLAMWQIQQMAVNRQLLRWLTDVNT